MTRHDVVHEDGECRIGQPRGYAGRPAGLSLPGGVLWVDPLDPEAVLLNLTEPKRARETVIALFGLHAWDSVSAQSGGKVSEGWGLPIARRLALIDWLGTHSPDPLDEDLLAMESLVAHDQLSPLLDPQPVPQAVRARAVSIAEAAREGSPVGTPEVTRLALSLLQLLADSGDAEASRLTDALADLPSSDHPPGNWPFETVLTAIPAGLVLGETVTPAPQWQTGGVDWDLVPRGAFDSDEDAVRWRVDESTAIVEVRGGWDTRGSYVARLWSPDEALPAALISLSRSDDGWTGTALLLTDVPNPDDCWVDVTVADDPRPARRGVARVEAQARRWSCRGATRLRYALGQGALLDSAAPMTDAIGCLERARIAYADAALVRDQGNGSRHLELGVTLLAALRRADEAYEVDDLAQELQTEGALPDAPANLDHRAWELTVAELGLLVPSVAG